MLENSIEVVRTGVPPVPATQAVLCLVVIAIGLVAVLVDTLAVSAGTPAASGLVLLCVYAVPASLAAQNVCSSGAPAGAPPSVVRRSTRNGSISRSATSAWPTPAR